MDSLKVSLLQTDLHWENPTANFNSIEEQLEKLYHKTDLVVLPEMFTTGFSLNAEEHADQGEALAFMKQHAAQGGFAIFGSVMHATQGIYVNRGLFVTPEGKVSVYDKRHTFSLVGEDKVFTKGGNQVVISYKNWKFNLQICYDLRFPVWSRNTSIYDAILYVANWPQPRIDAWDALLKARAIENMAYVIGVNRVGLDGNDMTYPGHSQVYDTIGKALLDSKWKESGIKTITLSKEKLKENRSKYQFLADGDSFTLA